MKDVKKQYQALTFLCKKINSSQNDLMGKPFFEEITILVKFNHSELCFNNLISWLYILYFEACSRNLQFISKKFQSYNISFSESERDITKVVHAFRTIFQHNTKASSKSDVAKKQFCESFYYSILRKPLPETEDDWVKCCESLLRVSYAFLAAVYSVIQIIQGSPNKDAIVDEWDKVINRSYSVFDFEKILINVFADFGFAGIFDTNKICKLEIDKWRKDLDVLADDFNFEIEARRILERFVLRKEVLPITSGDLLKIGFSPGTSLVDGIERAREIFYKDPCKKEILLQKIKENLR